ncbi:16S rRNA (guanine(527)-N(7))-methyltransferase RsmG [Campylobacter sp. 19-13652]|uniref:16S rRNA (guanine(527)-N(7))-methyltransferase RsmG n=1 Tax=Campylobacter sp. 19-13652 TaxID=2840180 RepID=UPI001C77868D|nr:16S rRNA (guanine(527)-N(7))-methyltransferase RsmG [Campylobacter sp. 19-13652]BCX78995.1 ribosomal RNA small subunit methyltransferase G [Campylobacter sp. 19-13652]
MSDFKLFCEEYARILDKFNRVHSLSRYKADELKTQIADSVLPLELFCDLTEAKRAIDVGSGAGLPALFLAAKMSQCEWSLYEPIAKKASFLSYCVASLGLKNVKINSQKIETSDKFKADLITSRALTNANALIELCSGFYDSSTLFLLYKGSEYKDEIEALKDKFKNAKIELKSGNEARIYALVGGLT